MQSACRLLQYLSTCIIAKFTVGFLQSRVGCIFESIDQQDQRRTSMNYQPNSPLFTLLARWNQELGLVTR